MPSVPGSGNGRQEWLRAVRVALVAAIVLQSRQREQPVETIIDRVMLGTRG